LASHGSTGGGGCSAGAFGIDPNAGAIATPAATGGGTTLNVSISTSNCPDEIIVTVFTKGTPSGVPTSAHLTFTQRVANTGNAPWNLYEYVAKASSTLTSESITFTSTTSVMQTMDAMAVTDIYTAAPFDSNGVIPNTIAGNTCYWTTSNANDFLFVYEIPSRGNDTVASGWTNLGQAVGNYLSGAGKVVSATQSSTASNTALTGNNNAAITCDAIIQGP